MLAAAWQKAATVKNASSSFKATGIVPFDPSAIPEYAYLTENPETKQRPVQNEAVNVPPQENVEDDTGTKMQPSTCAGMQIAKTPGNMPDEISPVPMTQAIVSARAKGRQLALVLTSSDNIENKKKKQSKKKQSEEKKNERNAKKKREHQQLL